MPRSKRIVQHPILFLDLDGVLNGLDRDRRASIHPECVEHFNRLLDESRAQVVISSTWRGMVESGVMNLEGFGALMVVWVWREPWAYVDVRKGDFLDSAPFRDYSKSPDQTRNAHFADNYSESRLIIYESMQLKSKGGNRVFDVADVINSTSGELDREVEHWYAPIQLCFIPIDKGRGVWHMTRVRFVDNQTIEVMYEENFSNVNVFRRRFPEWWWGHFYRPEVWLATGLSVALIWRTVRARLLKVSICRHETGQP